MRVVVDIGNTKIAFATVDDAHRVREQQRIERSDPHAVATGVRWCAQRAADLTRAAVASVVPETLRELRAQWAASALGVELVAIDHNTPRDFDCSISHLHTVGADRWCNVAAVVHAGAREAIVVSLGSAHTYDVLENRVFVGGLIAPGAGIAHRALTERGAQLPAVPFADPGVLVGRHTTEAIQAGSFHQAGAGVAGVIARLRADRPQTQVLVTGGLAPILAAYLPTDAEVDPTLTLRGASVLLGVR